MTRPSSAAGSRTARSDLIRLTTAALVAALVFLFTYLIKVPTVLGYIHLGDALVLLYAATGDPLALLAGALGEGLADLAGGYYQYIPATVLIKALIALPLVLGNRNRPEEKLLTKRNALLSLPSVPVTLGGYFLIDYLLGGAYAFTALWTNAVQAVGSLLVFAVLAAAFDRSGLKDRLF